MKDIHQHLRNNDYPEGIGFVKQLTRDCGYASFSCRYRDENKLHGVTTMTA